MTFTVRAKEQDQDVGNSHGLTCRRHPSEHASKDSPAGLYNGGKPFSRLSPANGFWASNVSFFILSTLLKTAARRGGVQPYII